MPEFEPVLTANIHNEESHTLRAYEATGGGTGEVGADNQGWGIGITCHKGLAGAIGVFGIDIGG